MLDQISIPEINNEKLQISLIHSYLLENHPNNDKLLNLEVKLVFE